MGQIYERLTEKEEEALTEKLLTTELIDLAKDYNDLFGTEYNRRMKLLNLTTAQIEKLYVEEKNLLENNIKKRTPWIENCFIFRNRETLPNHDDLTLTELITITDDANYEAAHHRGMNDKKWEAVATAAAIYNLEAKYLKALKERTQKMGWTEEQFKKYANNEFIILGKWKWEYDNYKHKKPWKE